MANLSDQQQHAMILFALTQYLFKTGGTVAISLADINEFSNANALDAHFDGETLHISVCPREMPATGSVMITHSDGTVTKLGDDTPGAPFKSE